jgi:hypothetical protein
MRQAIRAAIACTLLLAVFCGAAGSVSAQTQDPGTAPVPAGASLLNPAISVIGWFQGETGDQNNEEGTAAFEFREAEVGLQANVDPFSRADFFIAVTPEGVDIEEGYLSLFSRRSWASSGATSGSSTAPTRPRLRSRTVRSRRSGFWARRALRPRACRPPGSRRSPSI